MVKYQIRSRDLISIVNEIKAGRLIPDAYFQRNLVWRDIHKQDFIKTILLGLPFPQIFISRGKIDVENMTTTSCVVDGQQRINAIIDYIDDIFDVEGKKYSDLSGDEKAEFLKYEIATIELDLDNTDQRVKEIFQRVNRTANSLTVIEKIASEYAPSEYMLVANLLIGNFDIDEYQDEDSYKLDPNIPNTFIEWSKDHKVTKTSKLILNKGIFTEREIARKVHLMHMLNILSTVVGSFFNRNEHTTEFLNDYAQEFSQKEEIVNLFEKTSDYYLKLRFGNKSYWHNKANFFSLYVAICKHLQEGKEIDVLALKAKLEVFELNTPPEYKLAAKEAVNNVGQRLLRNRYIVDLLTQSNE
jgi:hypothetical protein